LDFKSFIRAYFQIIGQDAKSGALPTLMAALEPSVKGGEYYGPDGFMEAKGNPFKVKSTGLSHNVVYSSKIMARVRAADWSGIYRLVRFQSFSKFSRNLMLLGTCR